MESGPSLKQDVKKFKKLTHHVEGWSLKAREFIHQTQVICGSALASGHGKEIGQQFDDMLLESVQIMSAAVGAVTDLTNLKGVEVTREVQKKGIFSRYPKDSSLRRGNIHSIVEDAVEGISLALVDALHVQARQFDHIAEQCSSLIESCSMNKVGRVTGPNTPSAKASSEPTFGGWSGSETDIHRSTPGGGAMHDLDWDAFEKDLMEMTTAVGGNAKLPPVPGYASISLNDEIQSLLATQEEMRIERDDALIRAEEAEKSLADLKRQHEFLVEDMHHDFTMDDVTALQVALKQEQVARAVAESELHVARMQARAAEDDAQANHFALTVVQQVASQMATDANTVRRRSTGTHLGSSHTPVDGPVVQTAPRFTSDQAIAISTEDSEQNIPVAETPVEESMRRTRTDSAFMTHEENEDLVIPVVSTVEDDESSALVDYSTDQGSSAVPAESELKEVQQLTERASLPLPETLPLVAPNTIQKRLSTSSRNRSTWNPFDASNVDDPGAPNQSIPPANGTCDSRLALDQEVPTQGSWNPFSGGPSTAKRETCEEPPSAEWNPFSQSGPIGEESISKKIDKEPSSFIPVDAAWNPFGDSAKENSRPAEDEAWNPFNSEPTQKSEEPWNPFSNASAGNSEPETKECGWNPFGPSAT